MHASINGDCGFCGGQKSGSDRFGSTLGLIQVVCKSSICSPVFYLLSDLVFIQSHSCQSLIEIVCRNIGRAEVKLLGKY